MLSWSLNVSYIGTTNSVNASFVTSWNNTGALRAFIIFMTSSNNCPSSDLFSTDDGHNHDFCTTQSFVSSFIFIALDDGDGADDADDNNDDTDDDDGPNIPVDNSDGDEDVGIDDDEDEDASIDAVTVTDWSRPSLVDLDVVIERRLLLVSSTDERLDGNGSSSADFAVVAAAVALVNDSISLSPGKSSKSLDTASSP